tara:strand:- start:1581 stop:2450 length:870 start_codon:yes stop_codon:yes gene_type:complete
MKQTLAMCIRCRDDLECLKENIEYHTLIGVEHFFIYDHESAIPLKSALADYDNVTVECVSKWEELIACYNKCWSENKNNFQWIAFIDTDEFIVMKDGNTDLKEFLKPYEKYGGLAIWWRCFSSSGHKKKQKSVIHDYTRASRFGGVSVKSIVNTKFTLGVGCQHHHRYKPGYFAVFQDFSRVKMHPPSAMFPGPEGLGEPAAALVPESERTLDNHKIQLNHYIVRSREDFELKRARHDPNATDDWNPSEHMKNMNEQYWNVLNSPIMQHEDTSIITLINLIKKKNQQDK